MPEGQKWFAFRNPRTGEVKTVRGRNLSDARQRVRWGKDRKEVLRIRNYLGS